MISKRIRALNYYLSGIINKLEISLANPCVDINLIEEERLKFIFKRNEDDFDIKVLNFLMSLDDNIIPFTMIPHNFYSDEMIMVESVFDCMVNHVFDLIENGLIHTIENMNMEYLFKHAYNNKKINVIQFMYATFIFKFNSYDDRTRRFIEFYLANKFIQNYTGIYQKTEKIIFDIIKKSKLMLESN